MLDLTVNGQDHSGWLSMAVERSITQFSGAFSVDVTTKDNTSPLIKPGDLCLVSIRNQIDDPRFQVIQGNVETLTGGGDENSVDFSISGRDRSGDLVRSHVTRNSEWNDYTFAELVADLASDFKIPVAVDSAVVTDKKVGQVNYDPGTTYQELIAEYAQREQLLVYTLSNGTLFITRASKQRGQLSLVEGKNIKSHTINMDWSEVYNEYIVKGSRQSQDNDSEEEVTQVEACAIDSRFPRPTTIIITPDTELTNATAQQIADWHATTTLSRAEAYTATIQGWFPIFNQLAYVKIPSYKLDADMLIEGFRLTADPSGKKTEFNIVHPKAFDLLPNNTIETDSKDSTLIATQ